MIKIGNKVFYDLHAVRLPGVQVEAWSIVIEYFYFEFLNRRIGKIISQ